MTKKSKIIIVSIVGVIVVFALGALAGNLINSNNSKATTTTAKSSSTKSSSSSVSQYVEGTNYTIDRQEVDGITNSVVDSAMLKMGIATNQNNNLNDYMKKYAKITGYYDTNSTLGGNTLIFEFTRKDGTHEYKAYDVQYQDIDNGDNDASYLSTDLAQGIAKEVWKYTNIDLTK